MTPKLRKKCKLCRWKSCLEAGMSFGSMKMGRIPKRDLEKVEEVSQESMDTSTNSNSFFFSFTAHLSGHFLFEFAGIRANYLKIYLLIALKKEKKTK